MNVLIIRYRINCSLNNLDGKIRIYVSAKSMALLYSIVKPYMSKDMLYKIEPRNSKKDLINNSSGDSLALAPGTTTILTSNTDPNKVLLRTKNNKKILNSGVINEKKIKLIKVNKRTFSTASIKGQRINWYRFRP